MLTLGFGLLLTLLLLLIFTGLSKADLPADLRKKYVRNFAAGSALWLMYAATLGQSDNYQEFVSRRTVEFSLLTLPPLAFIFYLAFKKRLEILAQAVPFTWPVYLQSFRIVVELLFLGMLLQVQALEAPYSKHFSINILIGISAPAVAYWGYQRRAMSVNVLTGWSVVALFSTPYLWWHTISINLRSEFGTMPYLLIPAVFVPLGYFLSGFSLMQLNLRSAELAASTQEKAT